MRRPIVQNLTLRLDGLLAEDYLAWVSDPEPLGLARDLRAIRARAAPFSDRIELQLVWNREPPEPRVAAAAAGFPITANVAELRDDSRCPTADRSRRWLTSSLAVRRITAYGGGVCNEPGLA